MSNFDLRKADNYVEAEGYLESKDIEEKTFEFVDNQTNEKRTMQRVVGNIVVAVDDTTKIKFRVKVNKFTMAGTVSKVYEKIMAVKDNYISRADCAAMGKPVTEADRVKVKGTFDHNDHLNADNTKLWSYGVYSFTFAERVDELKFQPHAKFNVEMYCADIQPEVRDEVATGRAIIDGIVPLYNKVIPIRFYFGQTEDGVDLGKHILEHYEVGKTTKIWGIIKGEVYSSESKSSNIIGAPQTFESISLRAIPTSIEGEQYAITDVKAYDKEAIKAALNAREEMLEKIRANIVADGAGTVGATSTSSAPKATTERALDW